MSTKDTNVNVNAKPSVIPASDHQALEQAAKQAEQSLPPPGPKRAEALAQQRDALAQQAEEMTAASDMEVIDPSAIEEDREILYLMEQGLTDVPGALPLYEYCWVYTGKDGIEIMSKKSIRVATSIGVIDCGWEVVDAGMPEAPDYKDVNGHRRWGDTILMRRLVTRGNIHRQYQQKLNNRFNSVTEREKELFDMDERNRRAGAPFRLADVPDNIEARSAAMQPPGSAKRLFLKQAALGQMDTMLREGTVPGVAPGR